MVSNNKKQGQKNRRNPPVFNFGRNPFAPTRDKQKYRIKCGIFIYFGGTVDSNDKILLSCSNVSLALSQKVINLRGIRDNLPAFGTWQIYSLSPRPENSNRRICDGFC